MEKCEKALIRQWRVQYNHRWHAPQYEMKHNGATIAPRIIKIGHMVLQQIPQRTKEMRKEMHEAYWLSGDQGGAY